jgi:hypothetical protein
MNWEQRSVKKPYYVVLTGSKNNAGDFLIKDRALRLLNTFRPDRDVIDLDAWKPLSDSNLDIVNDSKALIFLGGPALQTSMFPKIYPLTKNIDDIKAPMATMGIGWKSSSGSMDAVRNYPLSDETLTLLSKIEGSGLVSSVRDFHTQKVLQQRGFKSFINTGCPALHDLDREPFSPNVDGTSINRIAFSLGVSFLSSPAMEEQMKATILGLRENFSGSDLNVVFHHSLDESFLETHGASHPHLEGHRRFRDWLVSQGIDYIDISGSAEKLKNYYQGVDIHVGYRVHAHIYMTSVGKLSLLIAEDGRGKALRTVIGGCILDAGEGRSDSLSTKILARLGLKDRYDVDERIPLDVIQMIRHERHNGFPMTRSSQYLLPHYRNLMRRYIEQLP